MSIEQSLFQVKKADYGESYSNHFFEQYKVYVETTDRISSRRQTANSFFLSVNTAVIAIVGYVQLGQKTGSSESFYWLVSLTGILLCYTWYRLIRSYKDLNSGKFKVVHAMEANLPMAPFEAEWESLGGGKKPKLYHPFTKVEMVVPWAFLVLHVLVLLQLIPWKAVASLVCSGQP